MPRSGRIVPKIGILHVINRGNNGNVIFYNDKDKLKYYSLLRDLQKENKIDIFHYCLMNTHTHIILNLNPESNLARFMKQLNLSYFHYSRRQYDSFGHLWQGRFKSYVVDRDAYLLQCGKYIELNPVRAGIVENPENYLYSSYCFYAYGKPDAILTFSPTYLQLADSATKRQNIYINYVIE